MRMRQVVDYVAMALIWGVSFLLLLHVVRAFGWVGAVTFRALIASLVLLALARATGRHLEFNGAWRHLAVIGATTVAGQLIGMSFALPRIGTAMAAIIVATIPLFSMVIGQVWGIEHIGRDARVGLALGVAGIFLLVGFPAVPITGSFAVGTAGSLFAAVSAAFGSNYAVRFIRHIGSWEQTIGAFLFGSLLTMPLLLLVPVPRTPTIGDVGYLLLLAAMCSALAYVLYFRLVSEVGATIAITVEFAVTVVAVTIGALLLHESLTAVQLLGATSIIVGCVIVLGLMPWQRRALA